MAGATVKTADFTNVKERSIYNNSQIKAGDYLAEVVMVKDSKTKKTGEFQYEFAIKLKKKPSSVFPYYCQLSEKTLWKLRNLLIAAGINVPKTKTKVDPNKVVGRLIGVTIEDGEPYEGREKSEITGVFPASELTDAVTDDDDDDDEPEESNDSLDDDDFAGDIDEGEAADEPEEAEEEPEAESEAESTDDEGDEWDAITDRLELRKALKKVAPDVKTTTAMSEDDIRDLIRKHSAPKKSANSVSDEELEELDLDDL